MEPHHASGHPIIQSFEPGEDWYWDFTRSVGVLGPHLADPQHRPEDQPEDQPVPGPAGRVPEDGQDHIH